MLHLILLVASQLQRALSQTPSPYADLPATPLINTTVGSFLWPAGETGIFTEGSLMNVSWTTLNPSINIYLLVNQSWDTPIALVSEYSDTLTFISMNSCWLANYADTSTEWTVDCGQHCSVPSMFRAVGAQASPEDQRRGGFLSRQFWIWPTATSGSLGTAATIMVSSSDQQRATILHTSPSDQDVNTIDQMRTGSNLPATATTGSAASNQHGSDDRTSVGVGVGVGVGVALLLVGAFVLWHRYRKRTKDPYADPPKILEQRAPSDLAIPACSIQLAVRDALNRTQVTYSCA